MKLKKEFNNVLFLVGAIIFTVFGLGGYYDFSHIINLLIMLCGFGLFITYGYFVKNKVLEYVMHGLVAFSALFNFIVTLIVMIDFGSYSVLSGLFNMFFIMGFSCVYAFYYLLSEKTVKEVKAEKAPAEEVKAEETEDAVNSEIKELNAAYAQGNLTAEEYDEKMKNLQNKDI